jgi:hypothetical protein
MKPRSIVHLLVIILVVVGLALDPVVPRRSEGAGGCTHVVKNTGSGETKFRVCVSAAGNIIEFETPAGDTLIHPTFYEGYHLCSDSTIAWDHSPGYVGGFGAPVLVDSSPVTINRTTSNGVFTVTQSFAADSTEKDLKVTMKVKNNSAVTQTTVWIGRGWDAGIGLEESGWANGSYSVTMLYFDPTGWPFPPGHRISGGPALTLTALSPRTGTLYAYAGIMRYDSWANMRGFPSMCRGYGMSNTDLSSYDDKFAVVSYHLGSIAPGATKTVIFNYRRL